MTTSAKIERKLRAACNLITSCISPHDMGIWASRGRYANQLWTRDFVLAAAPALELMGRMDVVYAHLNELLRLQHRVSGKVPILFLDSEKDFLKAKIDRSVKEGKWSFMLKRYFEDGGVENLSPWTRDSEILFAIALLEYRRKAALTRLQRESTAVLQALQYVERNMMKDGLALGADWRDTNTWLADKALLSNNCLLFRAYQLNNQFDHSDALQKKIYGSFWTGTHFRDYVGVETADTLGQALGVIYGAIVPESYPAVLESFASLHTARGYLSNDCRPNPVTPEEKRLLRLKRMKQSFVIWPFIHGYAILALLKMGEAELAEKAFSEYTNLSGFWEYYDPKTGQGYGAKEQLWSAALYIRVAAALGYFADRSEER